MATVSVVAVVLVCGCSVRSLARRARFRARHRCCRIRADNRLRASRSAGVNLEVVMVVLNEDDGVVTIVKSCCQSYEDRKRFNVTQQPKNKKETL